MEEIMLEAKAELQILKSSSEVFEAIVDPSAMTKFFISESSGRMEQGKTITWKFPEFDMKFPVRCGKIIRNEYISFYWENQKEELKVEMKLKPGINDSTVISITEKSMKNDEAGIKWLTGNTAGWANFLACLKAWLEYGINLRKGAFDYMRE